MGNQNKRCKKCNSQLVNDHGTLKCLACGWEYENNFQRHKFIESHKDEILEDLATLGNEATRKKWRLSTSTIPKLKKKALNKSTPKPSKDGNTPPNFTLPALPPWSDEWISEVQIKWLSVYESLAIKGH